MLNSSQASEILSAFYEISKSESATCSLQKFEVKLANLLEQSKNDGDSFMENLEHLTANNHDTKSYHSQKSQKSRGKTSRTGKPKEAFKVKLGDIEKVDGSTCKPNTACAEYFMASMSVDEHNETKKGIYIFSLTLISQDKFDKSTELIYLDVG